jgi:hypothetical protein
MSDLEKRISGDWIDLRERSNDLYELLEALAIPSYEMRAAANTLRFCVEQGLIEHKRTVLNTVYSVLEAARFTSIPGEDLAAQERSLGALLLVVLVQRLLCSSVIPLARQPEDKSAPGAEGIPVGAILSDVNARVKANPEMRTHGAVKNILMQVQRYNAENLKMRELLPTIKPEMRTAFLANFTRTFDEIIGAIRRQHAALLKEERTAERSRRETFSLAALPLKELVPLCAGQAKEIALVRSTLRHAREEKYKTREALVRLYDQRQTVLRLVEEEERAYRKVCQAAPPEGAEGCAASVGAAFRDEIVGILEKQGRKQEEAERAGTAGA